MKKPPMTIVAEVSALNISLPEGDYTDLVERIYVNGRILMVEFKADSYSELLMRRKVFGD